MNQNKEAKMQSGKKKRKKVAGGTSKGKTKPVKTPGGVAGQMQALKASSLKLAGKVTALETRLTNLELMVSDLQVKVSELATALGRPALGPKDFLPLAGGEC